MNETNIIVGTSKLWHAVNNSLCNVFCVDLEAISSISSIFYHNRRASLTHLPTSNVQPSQSGPLSRIS
ncbi:unnamed protein product [Allacma fusca]|uniref:Uncharacterized protein n=1 Tax=Allacma fusca TaxID=39272 RepID=A0A8J2LPC1_9HEXA|nr:unnamed protein product [Allacma fusca]